MVDSLVEWNDQVLEFIDSFSINRDNITWESISSRRSNLITGMLERLSENSD